MPRRKSEPPMPCSTPPYRSSTRNATEVRQRGAILRKSVFASEDGVRLRCAAGGCGHCAPKSYRQVSDPSAEDCAGHDHSRPTGIMHTAVAHEDTTDIPGR